MKALLPRRFRSAHGVPESNTAPAETSLFSVTSRGGQAAILNQAYGTSVAGCCVFAAKPSQDSCFYRGCAVINHAWHWSEYSHLQPHGPSASARTSGEASRGIGPFSGLGWPPGMDQLELRQRLRILVSDVSRF